VSLSIANHHAVPPVLDQDPGRMENTFANECFMDELAAAGPAVLYAAQCSIAHRITPATIDVNGSRCDLRPLSGDQD
jgi:hypothetical protein